jgi:hypothetical protein
MQGSASRMPDLLAAFPTLDIDTLLDRLLDFLGSADGRTISTQCVSASRYLGSENAARYANLFMKRSGLLAGLLAQTEGVPLTINHGDLQAAKIELRPDKSCKIREWEHTMINKLTEK